MTALVHLDAFHQLLSPGRDEVDVAEPNTAEITLVRRLIFSNAESYLPMKANNLPSGETSNLPDPWSEVLFLQGI